MTGNARGALLALAAFGIYASHDVIVKLLGVDYSSFQIVFFSVLFGFPLATLMLMGDAAEENLRPRHPWWGLARVLATSLTGMTVFYAFSVLPLAQVYAILFSTPLLITALSVPLLGEKVGPRRWAAVVVGLCGVLIVLRPGSAELSLGHMAALFGAVCSALASIIVRKVGREERSVVLLLMPMLGSFLLMGAILPFVYVPMQLPGLGLVAAMSAMGFVAAWLTIRAYKSGEAVVVAPMQYSQILWAVLFGAVLFDEWPDGATLLGAGVVIASGLYIVLRESRVGGSANTPVLRTRTRFETGTGLRIGPMLRRRRSGDRG